MPVSYHKGFRQAMLTSTPPPWKFYRLRHQEVSDPIPAVVHNVADDDEDTEHHDNEGSNADTTTEAVVDDAVKDPTSPVVPVQPPHASASIPPVTPVDSPARQFPVRHIFDEGVTPGHHYHLPSLALLHISHGKPTLKRKCCSGFALPDWIPAYGGIVIL